MRGNYPYLCASGWGVVSTLHRKDSFQPWGNNLDVRSLPPFPPTVFTCQLGNGRNDHLSDPTRNCGRGRVLSPIFFKVQRRRRAVVKVATAGAQRPIRETRRQRSRGSSHARGGPRVPAVVANRHRQREQRRSRHRVVTRERGQAEWRRTSRQKGRLNRTCCATTNYLVIRKSTLRATLSSLFSFVLADRLGLSLREDDWRRPLRWVSIFFCLPLVTREIKFILFALFLSPRQLGVRRGPQNK